MFQVPDVEGKVCVPQSEFPKTTRQLVNRTLLYIQAFVREYFFLNFLFNFWN